LREVKIEDADYVRFKGKWYSILGKTFVTADPLKIGNIARIKCDQIRKVNPTLYKWIIAKVLEVKPEPGSMDTLAVAEEIARATKEIVEEEKKRAEGFESTFAVKKAELAWFLTELPCSEEEPLKLQMADLLVYPDESKGWLFVVQAHIRGLSVHGDNRNEISDTKLVGWTWSIIKSLLPEMLAQHVTPQELSEADVKLSKEELLKLEIDEMSEKIPDPIKRKLSSIIDEMSPSELEKIIRKRIPEIKKFLSDPTNKIFTTTKATEPHEWLTFQGKVEPGRVGATKEHPGFFIILDKGRVEFGCQKPYAHEYWFHGDVFNGHFYIRQIARRPEWEKAGRRGLVWMTFRARDEAPPYVLSSRAVEEGWIPPKGVSCLPEKIRKQIPDQYKYWLKPDPRKTRDTLVATLRKKKLVLKFAAPKLQFQVKRFWWKGPTQIRGMPQIFWAIILHDGEDVKEFWHFDEDPTEHLGILATVERFRDLKLIEEQGEFHRGHALNPNLRLPLYYDTIDEGAAEIIAESSSLFRVRLKGKRLSGLYVFLREDPKSEMWKFLKSELPKPKMEASELEGGEPQGFLSFITDIEGFDPSKSPDTELARKRMRDDWRLTMAWWSSKRQGKPIQRSYDLIFQTALNLARELIKRKWIRFHPEEYKEHSKELFEKVVKQLEKEGIEIPIADEETAKRSFSSPEIKVIQVENIAVASGLAIKEGEMIGMDLKPTFFSADVINRTFGQMAGNPISLTHGERKGDVVGYVERVKAGEGRGWIDRGIVWDQETIPLLLEQQKGTIPPLGWSVEVFPKTVWDEVNQRDVVVDARWVGVALVPNPACGKECLVADVKLEKASGGKIEDLERRFGEPLENFLRRRYLQDQASTEALAEECDISKQTLLRWFERFNIPTRTLSEAASIRWAKEETDKRKFSEPIRVTVLGTGCETPIPKKDCNCPQCREAQEGGPSKRGSPSLLIEADSDQIIIDAGPDILNQLSQLKLQPSTLILTHAHPDHAGGLKDLKFKDLKVYASRDTWTRIKNLTEMPFKKLVFTPERAFRIGKIRVLPFPVEHSIVAPAVGFKISIGERSLIYAPDVLEIPNRTEILEDVDCYIGNGSSLYRDLEREREGKHFGHASIKKQITEWGHEAEIPVKLFTHIGHLQMTHASLQEKVKELYREADVLKDGDSFNLSGSNPGLYLVSPHAEMLWSGEKKMIVKARPFTRYSKQAIPWCDRNLCYGYLVMGLPEGPFKADIVLEKFRDLHRITDKEWAEWWPKAEQVWTYRPKIVKRFDPPKKWRWVPFTQVFIPDVILLE